VLLVVFSYVFCVIYAAAMLLATHMRKPPKAHVFTVIKKENWHYKNSSFRGEELYRGETTT
jgi:hypothetical protein